MREFQVMCWGPAAASVCTSLPLEEATSRLNVELPIEMGPQWAPSKDPTFKGGQSNPCACETHSKTHKHYLFSC